MVFKESGALTDFGADAQDAWTKKVEKYVNDANTAFGSTQFVMPNDTDLEPTVSTVDWRGFPLRINECLGSIEDTNRFLDWQLQDQPMGRLNGAQEEYLEWRIIRNSSGRISAIEFTSETQEYWQTLASYHPEKTLELIGKFASEAGPADPLEVYGPIDLADSTPEQRGNAFLHMMDSREVQPSPGDFYELVASPYNNGKKALTFMADYPNTLGAAVYLAAAAAIPYAKSTPAGTVPLTGREAIQNTRQSAQDCRDSDPTIVGSVIALANEQRKIALYEHPGLYIGDVDHKGILLPDESDHIPREWFKFSRGVELTINGSKVPLWQRLKLEVPESEGFLVEDLIDADSGSNLLFGAIVAKKITINLYAQASDINVTSVPVRTINPSFNEACNAKSWCADVKNKFQLFETGAMPMATGRVDRFIRGGN